MFTTFLSDFWDRWGFVNILELEFYHLITDRAILIQDIEFLIMPFYWLHLFKKIS